MFAAKSTRMWRVGKDETVWMAGQAERKNENLIGPNIPNQRSWFQHLHILLGGPRQRLLNSFWMTEKLGAWSIWVCTCSEYRK